MSSISPLKKKKESLEDQVKTLNTNISVLSQEEDRLKRGNLLLKTEGDEVSERLFSETKSLLEDVSRLKKEKEVLSNDRDNMAKDVSKLGVQNVELQVLISENKKKLELEEGLRNQLLEEKEYLEDGASSLQVEFDKCSASFIERRQQLDEANNSLSQVEEDISDKEDELDSLVRRVADKEKEDKKWVGEKRDDLIELESSLNNKEERLQESEEKLFQDNELLLLTKEICDKEIETLNKSKKELKKLRGELDDRDRELRARETQYNIMNDELLLKQRIVRLKLKDNEVSTKHG